MRTGTAKTIRLALAAVGLATLALLAGCGSTTSSGSSRPDGIHTMPDRTVMSDSQMTHMRSDHRQPGTGPSAAAEMVCSAEVADAVQRTYALSSRPAGSGSWSPSTHVYTCRYQLPHSLLTLTVKDLNQPLAGRAYFHAQQERLSASPIRGMENLGFPAFENTSGQVAFLKDAKTLLVDASTVIGADLPPKSTRTETAYGIATAVIACWKE